MAKIDKLTERAQMHLDPSETVDGSVLGAYEARVMGQDSVRSGVLLATNRRLVFYAKKVGGYDLESFPYENLSSFEQGRTLMGGTITFFASGNKVAMKWIKEGDLHSLTELVRSRMGKPTAGPAVASPAQPLGGDVLWQIQQLASLRDAGVLTENEFAAKKADLLGRL